MKILTKFFFYYTLISLNALTVVSIFFLQAPLNLLYAVVLAPSTLFFWLKVTDPKGATESSWSARIVITIGIVSSLLILALYLQTDSNTKSKHISEILDKERSESSVKIASASAEINRLKLELDDNKAKDEQDKQTLPDTNSQEVIDLLNSLPSAQPSPTSTPLVSAKGKVKAIKTADVYEDRDSSSKVIGIVEKNSTYDYFDQNGNWYLIQIVEGRTGWVEFDKVYVQK